MEGDRTGVGESDMKRRKRGKQTLKRKMLSILLLCAMSCILAVVIVSYMTIRMIQNDSIQESMQIYLEQITREIDSDYYDMIGYCQSDESQRAYWKCDRKLSECGR